MKKFTSISRSEAIEIYPHIIKNYERLKKTADFAYTDANYGTALSLYILSSEELIKAFVIFLHSIGVNVLQAKELKGVFSQHKKKHELSQAVELIAFMESFILLTDKETYKPNVETGSEWLDKISGFVSGIGKIIEPISKFDKNAEWWDEADYYKNRGLYVDYCDDLKTPLQITKEQSSEGKEKAEKLFDRIRKIKIVFEKLPKQEQKQLIYDTNIGLVNYLLQNNLNSKN
ncbi:AbiV family abortive infection protein [Saccharicrinis sp. 156]|uniref:AbiV family abortive infection protein n=1 Tax=Saccharicrinis sp. 156 TaxID=3417574 RepID=UPI003D32901F